MIMYSRPSKKSPRTQRVPRSRSDRSRDRKGALLIFLIATASATAQPPAHLTLAQAQQLAIQHNPQFTAARYNAEAAYQTAPQYKAAYQPTVFGSEEHTSELQSLRHLVCRLLLEKNN